MAAEPVHLDEVFALAVRLSLLDKVRLIGRIAALLEHDLTPPAPPPTAPPPDAADSPSP